MQVDQKGLEDLQMARSLIQEAKGFEGELGGPITDHLDAAEGWLDRVEAVILAHPPASEKEPVAWMTADGRVATDETKRTAMARPSREVFNIPLYAHPGADR